MAEVFSTKGSIDRLGTLLKVADSVIREERLKTFKHAILESTKETIILESDIDKILQKVKEKNDGNPLNEINRGVIFSEDAELRWEKIYQDFTFLFIVESNQKVEGFGESISVNESSTNDEYLWNNERIPNKPSYQCKDRFTKIKVKEYSYGLTRSFSRFCEFK